MHVRCCLCCSLIVDVYYLYGFAPKIETEGNDVCAEKMKKVKLKNEDCTLKGLKINSCTHQILYISD